MPCGYPGRGPGRQQLGNIADQSSGDVEHDTIGRCAQKLIRSDACREESRVCAWISMLGCVSTLMLCQ